MPAGIIGRKQLKNRTSRSRATANRPIPVCPISIVTATKGTTAITLVLSAPVTLKGTPAYTTSVAGVTAISATLTNPTTLVVTFSASIAAATTITIPFEEPAMRSASGGYLTAGTFPVT